MSDNELTPTPHDVQSKQFTKHIVCQPVKYIFVSVINICFSEHKV